MILELTMRRTRTVLRVVESAMTVSTSKAGWPNTVGTAKASGASEEASWFQGTRLTAASPTRTYSAVLIPTAISNARGIVVSGRFVSSAMFAMLSKPIYAKKTRITAPRTPAVPFGDHMYGTDPSLPTEATTTMTRPTIATRLRIVFKRSDSLTPPVAAKVRSTKSPTAAGTIGTLKAAER